MRRYVITGFFLLSQREEHENKTFKTGFEGAMSHNVSTSHGGQSRGDSHPAGVGLSSRLLRRALRFSARRLAEGAG